MRAKGRGKLRVLSIVAASTVPNLLLAQTSTWTYAPGGGNWIASWNDVSAAKPWSPNTSFPNSSTTAVILPAIYGAGPTPVITAGSGTIVLNGLGVRVSQISFFGGGSNDLANPQAVGGFNITGTGSITLAASISTSVATINVGSSGRVGNTTIPGIATISTSLGSGSGTVYKTGPGTLVLAGSNSFAGSDKMQIDGGSLRMMSTNALNGLQIVATSNDGQLELSNASSAGTIIFGAGSTTVRPEGVLYSSAGDNTWSGLWFLNAPGQTIGVATNSTLTLNGDIIDVAFGAGLKKTGGGTFAIGAATLGNPLTISAGTLKTKLGSGAPTDIPGLTIAGGATPTAKWDLTNNKLVIRNGNQATINSYLAAGFNGGAWTGNGITSSIAQADAAVNAGLTVTGIGMVRGDQLPDWNGTSSHFGSLTLSASDLALMYALTGDTNLDGLVDATADFNHYVAGLTAAASFNSLVVPNVVSGVGDWFHGDLNFDGTVDIDHDFALFVAGYGYSGSSPNVLKIAITNSASLTPIQKQTMLQMVPEPYGIGVMLVAWASLARRRRNNKSIA